MSEAIEAQAFEVVSKHARFADLVALTEGVAVHAATARSVAWRPLAESLSESERGSLTVADCETELGNVWTALEAGPKTEGERALLRALWAHAVAEGRKKATGDDPTWAARVGWLAAYTPFDATTLLDRALGDAGDAFWAALGARLLQLDAGPTESAGRGEALAAVAALLSSDSSGAKEEVTRLASALTDKTLLRLLSAHRTAAPSELRGKLDAVPRGPVATVVLAVTGILFISAVARLAARLALAYQRPADVTVTADAVRVRSRTLLLGRTIRERDIVLGRQGLLRAVREVRHASAAFYAGLFALGLGSLVGVRVFVDGVRAASPSLLFYGLLIVTSGIALDFLLARVGIGRSGTCRVLFVGRDGESVCVRDIDVALADAALGALARP